MLLHNAIKLKHNLREMHAIAMFLASKKSAQVQYIKFIKKWINIINI